MSVFDIIIPSNNQQTIALFISAPDSCPLFSRLLPSPASLSPSTINVGDLLAFVSVQETIV